jgi:hypothetical protein
MEQQRAEEQHYDAVERDFTCSASHTRGTKTKAEALSFFTSCF